MHLLEFPGEILRLIFYFTESQDIGNFYRSLLTWKGSLQLKEDWYQKVFFYFVGAPYKLDRSLQLSPNKKKEGNPGRLFEIPRRRTDGKILLMSVNVLSESRRDFSIRLVFWEISPTSTSALSSFHFPSIMNSSFHPLMMLTLDTQQGNSFSLCTAGEEKAAATATECLGENKKEGSEGKILLAWICGDFHTGSSIEVWEIDPNPMRIHERQENRSRLLQRISRIHDNSVTHFLQYRSTGGGGELKALTISTDKTLKIWNLVLGICEMTLHLSTLSNYDQAIQLSWSLDGRILLTTSNYSEAKVTIQLWNVNSASQSGEMTEEIVIKPMKGERQGLRVMVLLELNNQQDPIMRSSPHHSDTLQVMILLNSYEVQLYSIAPFSDSKSKTSSMIICFQRFHLLPGNTLADLRRLAALELQDGRIALLFGQFFNIYSLKTGQKVYCCNRYVYTNDFLGLSDGRIATATSTGIIEFWKKAL